MKLNKKTILWIFGLVCLIILLIFPVNSLNQTWQSWKMPLQGKTIVIDPGHGGPDGGAVGRDGTVEKEIVLSISKKLRQYLEQSGAIVYLTRETDKDLAHSNTKRISQRKTEDIRNRLQFIEEKEADFYLSIHSNFLGESRWRGAQTFFYPRFSENERLAKSIQAEMVDKLENTTRKALSIDGVYLLKYVKVPGALVEVGFLSNSEELELLKDENYQQKVANSIYYGILRYEEKMNE